MKGRPIGNLSKSYLHPLATYLNEILVPVQTTCVAVVESSKHLMDRVANTTVPHDFEISTHDIQNLYPQIPKPRLLMVVARALRRHYKDLGFTNWIMTLTEFLLDAQFISFDGGSYRNLHGIITGLCCAVTLANIFINELDILALEAMREHCGTGWLYRLVDDVVMLSTPAGRAAAIHVMNNWDDAIKWDHGEAGQEAIYLDVRIQILHGRLVFRLYRKPQNSYQYIMPNSCHHHSVFDGIVKGELMRIHRCNQENKEAVAKDVKFFFAKMHERGHAYWWLKKQYQNFIDNRYSTSTSVFNTKKTTEKTNTKKPIKAFLKVPFSRSTPLSKIRGILNKHKHWLLAAFKGHDVSFGIAHCSQKNIFRTLYQQNWGHSIAKNMARAEG